MTLAAWLGIGVVVLCAIGGPLLLLRNALRKAREDGAREIQLKEDALAIEKGKQMDHEMLQPDDPELVLDRLRKHEF